MGKNLLKLVLACTVILWIGAFLVSCTYMHISGDSNQVNIDKTGTKVKARTNTAVDTIDRVGEPNELR